MTTAELQTVTHELIPFAEEKLLEVASEYAGLTINGLGDKGGFEQVHKARMVVKGYRVDIENRRKQIKAKVIERGRLIDSEAKRLTALIATVEDHLAAEEQAYQDAIDAIKRAEEEKRQAVLIAKVEQLAAVGVTTTTFVVANQSEEDFAAWLAKSTAEHAERVAQEEAERKAREEAEAARLLAEVNARLGINRAQGLLRFGATVSPDIMGEMPDDEYQAIYAKVKADHEERERVKAEEEAELKAEREKLDAERKALEAEKLKAEQAERERQAAERARQEERDRIEREKRAAEEKAAFEAEEQALIEASRPDREKLLAVADAVKAIVVPEMATDYPGVKAGAMQVRQVLGSCAARIREIAKVL